MVITDTLHGAYGGSHMTKRLADILEPQDEEQETRSADEIINHMKEKIKALGGENDGNESF